MQTENVQPERSAGRIIARNTLFGIGSQFALRVAGFIFTIVVVRTLGDDNFGEYSIVLAWAGLFSVIGDMGINQYLAREIARNHEIVHELFWDTVVLRMILAIAASVITIGGAILVAHYPTAVVIGIALFTATYYFSALVAPLQSILTGYERLDIISVLNVLNQIIYMVLAGLFLYLGFNFVWLVIAGVTSMPVIAFMQWRAVRRNHLGPPRFRINRRMWFSLIKAGAPFAVTQLALTFANQVDSIFLSSLTNAQTVGWYSAAYRLTLTLYNLSLAFNTAVMPTLAREHARDPNSVRAWYYASARFIAIITLPIAVGGSILNQQIVLIYGQEFYVSSLAFALLIWDLPFVVFHAFSGYITASIKKEGAAARIHVTIGVLNIVLNAILIPRFGLIGACFATVLTDFVGAALFYRLFRRVLGAGLMFHRMIQIVIAAAIMGAVVWILRGSSLAITIPVSALVFGGLIWFSGAMTVEERHRIIHLIKRGLALRAV